MKSVLVHVCCNDHANGLFEGTAVSINVRDITLEHKRINGAKFTELDNNRFRLSRRIFPYISMREWIGNWCWNGYLMSIKDANEMLEYLRDSGDWQLTDCEIGFEKWWGAYPSLNTAQ